MAVVDRTGNHSKSLSLIKCLPVDGDIERYSVRLANCIPPRGAQLESEQQHLQVKSMAVEGVDTSSLENEDLINSTACRERSPDD